MLNGPSLQPVSGQRAKQLVVFLHGYGSHGGDLLELANYFAAALPDAEFLAPNAIEPGEYGLGYQWFTLMNRTPETYSAGLANAVPKLQNWLQEQLQQRGLAEKDLALIGFSQGAAMALHTAPRFAQAIGGVAAFSGGLVPAIIAAEALSRPPVLLVHGELDDVVPFTRMQEAETALCNLDFAVTTLPRPQLSHNIDATGINAAVRFFKSAFNQ